VPEHCTCGAELPPDARFCHKCGKPQGEEIVVVEEPTRVEPPRARAIAAAAINLRNPLAVRLGLFAALAATLLNVLLFLACPVWLMASGFLCVYLYEMRTGQELTVRNGVRMGWITGLFSAAIFVVPLLANFFYQVRSGELYKQLDEMPFFQGHAEQLRQLLNSPAFLLMDAVFTLLALFAVFSIFAMVGGALGAKVLAKERT
jgi:hypothetical protein